MFERTIEALTERGMRRLGANCAYRERSEQGLGEMLSRKSFVDCLLLQSPRIRERFVSPTIGSRPMLAVQSSIDPGTLHGVQGRKTEAGSVAEGI